MMKVKMQSRTYQVDEEINDGGELPCAATMQTNLAGLRLPDADARGLRGSLHGL